MLTWIAALFYGTWSWTRAGMPVELVFFGALADGVIAGLTVGRWLGRRRGEREG